MNLLALFARAMLDKEFISFRTCKFVPIANMLALTRDRSDEDTENCYWMEPGSF